MRTPLSPKARPLVLVVEDDAAIAESLCDALKGAGYRVDLARNGAEGIRRLRAAPDVKIILLDWSMPVMSGPEMLAALQKDPAWTGPSVVLLTAHPDAKSKALALRADGYLKKPVDTDDLLRMVAAITREHERVVRV